MSKCKVLYKAFRTEVQLFIQLFLGFFMLLDAERAMAAGGTGGLSGQSGIKGIFEEVLDMLDVISVVAIAIAFAFAGYKIAYGGRTIAEVAPILIGGILIGSCLYLAQVVLGKKA